MKWLVYVAWIAGLVVTKELYGLGSWGMYLLGSILFSIWMRLCIKDSNN